MIIKPWVTGHLRQRLIEEARSRGESIQDEGVENPARIVRPLVLAIATNFVSMTNFQSYKKQPTAVALADSELCHHTFFLYHAQPDLLCVPLKMLYMASAIFELEDLQFGKLQQPLKSRSDVLTQELFNAALNSPTLKSAFGV